MTKKQSKRFVDGVSPFGDYYVLDKWMLIYAYIGAKVELFNNNHSLMDRIVTHTISEEEWSSKLIK